MLTQKQAGDEGFSPRPRGGQSRQRAHPAELVEDGPEASVGGFARAGGRGGQVSEDLGAPVGTWALLRAPWQAFGSVRAEE